MSSPLPLPLVELLSSYLDVEDVFRLALGCHEFYDHLVANEKALFWTRLLQREVPFELTEEEEESTITPRQMFLRHFHSLDSWISGNATREDAPVLVLDVDLPEDFCSVAQLGLDCIVAFDGGQSSHSFDNQSSSAITLNLMFVQPSTSTSTGEHAVTMTNQRLHEAYYSLTESSPVMTRIGFPRTGMISVFNLQNVLEFTIRAKKVDQDSVSVPLSLFDVEVSFVQSSPFSGETQVHQLAALKEWDRQKIYADIGSHYGQEFRKERPRDANYDNDDNLLTVTTKGGRSIIENMEIGSHCNHVMYAFDGRYVLCADDAGEDAAYSFQLIDYRQGIRAKRGIQLPDEVNYVETEDRTLWLGSLSMLVVSCDHEVGGMLDGSPSPPRKLIGVAFGPRQLENSDGEETKTQK